MPFDVEKLMKEAVRCYGAEHGGVMADTIKMVYTAGFADGATKAAEVSFEEGPKAAVKIASDALEKAKELMT